MTTPGWYPNPDGTNSVRYWDGQAWQQVAEPSQRPATSSTPPSTPTPTPGQKGSNRRWWIGLGAAFVAFALIGSFINDGDSEENNEASQVETSPTTRATNAQTPRSAAAVAPTSAAPPATSAASTPRAASSTADPRCQPGEARYDQLIGSGLLDGSLKLANSQMIIDDGMVFYGASTVRPDGKFENRSDVWVIDTIPYTSTGGARNTTSWSKASDRLRIYPDDERVQAVDNCVVQLTRN